MSHDKIRDPICIDIGAFDLEGSAAHGVRAGRVEEKVASALQDVDEIQGRIDDRQVEMTIPIEVDHLEGAAPRPHHLITRSQKLPASQIAKKGEGTRTRINDSEIRAAIPIEVAGGDVIDREPGWEVDGVSERSVSLIEVERKGTTLSVKNCQIRIQIIIEESDGDRAGFWSNLVGRPVGKGAHSTSHSKGEGLAEMVNSHQIPFSIPMEVRSLHLNWAIAPREWGRLANKRSILAPKKEDQVPGIAVGRQKVKGSIPIPIEDRQ